MSVDMTDFMDTLENGNAVTKAAARRILQLSDELAQANTRNLELVLERNSLRDDLKKEKVSHLATIDQRDAAQTALSDVFCAVTGRGPEWSNLYGYADAIEEVEATIAELVEGAKPQPAGDGAWIEGDGCELRVG